MLLPWVSGTLGKPPEKEAEKPSWGRVPGSNPGGPASSLLVIDSFSQINIVKDDCLLALVDFVHDAILSDSIFPKPSETPY
jgi:hypothetical protein